MTDVNSASQSTPLVVIAAGGTGGHMFPAQSFAEEMKARGWRVGLVTDDRGARYIDKFPRDWVEYVQAATVSSKRPDKLLMTALKIRSGISSAKKQMRKDRPAVVAGFGGYPSFPSLAAAKSMKVPIIIHEQNAVLGRVNRVFVKAADFVACGFERLDRLPKAARAKKRFVGNPVRPLIRSVRTTPYPSINDGGLINILVTGGSQGAKLFGEVVPSAVCELDPVLRRRMNMVQQVREDQLDEVRATYADAGVECTLQPFFADMQEKLSKAHLVIARAGAGTVTELCTVGRPSILIPLGIAMDDHQMANAQAVEAAGGADVIAERNFNTQSLATVLNLRLAHADELADRAKAAHALGGMDAAKDLADLAEQAAGVTAAKTT